LQETEKYYGRILYTEIFVINSQKNYVLSFVISPLFMPFCLIIH